MTSFDIVVAALVSCLITLTVSPIIIGILQRGGVVDTPNERTSHTGEISRGGGIAVLLGILGGVSVTAARIGIDSTILVSTLSIVSFGTLGLVDDLFGLNARIRLALQSLMAVIYLAVADLSGVFGLAGLDLVVGAFWIVIFVNVFNFMDGINGISATTAVIVGGSLALGSVSHGAHDMGLVGSVVAGSATGFAPYNTPTARTFLGDVGSYGIGAALAIAALLAIDTGVPLAVVALPIAIYVGDVFVTLARRALRRERLMEAHRAHTYQLLANGPWSHLRTTLVVGLLTLFLAAAGLLMPSSAGWQILAFSLALVVVAGYTMLPTLLGIDSQQPVSRKLGR